MNRDIATAQNNQNVGQLIIFSGKESSALYCGLLALGSCL
jgi:hypothetical protein